MYSISVLESNPINDTVTEIVFQSKFLILEEVLTQAVI